MPGYEERQVSSSPSGAYPVTLDVDGPQPQSRLTVFFRTLMAIPHIIVLYLLNMVASLIGVVAWFVILFTGKYPGGMANFAVGAQRWQARAAGYILLLTGTYPPFSLEDDAAYPVRLSITPQIEGRNRLTCFFRYFMIIPQVIVMALVMVAAYVVLIIAWLVALFTGSVPAGMHTFLAGALRWNARVSAYQMLLTDEYPPFSLN